MLRNVLASAYAVASHHLNPQLHFLPSVTSSITSNAASCPMVSCSSWQYREALHIMRGRIMICGDRGACRTPCYKQSKGT